MEPRFNLRMINDEGECFIFENLIGMEFLCVEHDDPTIEEPCTDEYVDGSKLSREWFETNNIAAIVGDNYEFFADNDRWDKWNVIERNFYRIRLVRGRGGHHYHTKKTLWNAPDLTNYEEEGVVFGQ